MLGGLIAEAEGGEVSEVVEDWVQERSLFDWGAFPRERVGFAIRKAAIDAQPVFA